MGADFLPCNGAQWHTGLLISNAASAFASFCILVLLAYRLKRQRDARSNWMGGGLGLLIVACGATQAMEILTLGPPVSRLAVLCDVAAAILPLVTAVALWRLAPPILRTTKGVAERMEPEHVPQQQALAISKEREEQLALLFEQAGVGDFTWNIERDEVTAHPIIWSLYGYPEERGPQTAAWFAQRQHPDDAASINANVMRALENPASKVDLEFRIVQPDSSIRWVTCRGNVRRDDSGKPTEVNGLNIDISRLKVAEEAVRESERQLVAITDAIPQMVWFNDVAGNVEFFNERWYQYTGQAKEDSLDWGWQPAIHADDLADLISRWTHSLSSGLPYEAEFRLKAKDGSYRWHLGRGLPVADASGKIVRWCGTCTDIEERKASEARVLSANQEMETRVAERTCDLLLANDALRQARAGLLEAHNSLQQRVVELAETNKELAKKNEEVEAFVYIVSHDLRTPLVNLQGFSRELELSCDELRGNVAAVFSSSLSEARLEAILNDDIPGSLRYISASTAKFHRLINALLELSRYGREEYHSEELDMGAVVQSTVDFMHLSIAACGARVSLLSVPKVYGDATAVGQVFSNLIGNSIKYLQPGRPGHIEIGGESEDGSAHCWVRDNGAGLPASAKPRLFQVFQRFHPELAAGEGMGLAIARRIVERHGGKIWAEGEEGVGTTFHFTLPNRGGGR